MQDIVGAGEKVSKMIRAIEDIALQTNVLALNAAVETARARAAGLGFAVVAKEVRNLAQRCAQAARDTTSLIEESVSKSTEGGQRLDGPAESVASFTGSASQAKTFFGEQARGIEQVAGSITQIEQATHKNAACAEQSATAAQQLTAQSESLRAVVSDLSQLVGEADAST